jgi:hypothetical protein
VIIQYQKMAEKIQINLSNGQKKSSNEQFLKASRNWEKCSVLVSWQNPKQSATVSVGSVLKWRARSQGHFFQKNSQISGQKKFENFSKNGHRFFEIFEKRIEWHFVSIYGIVSAVSYGISDFVSWSWNCHRNGRKTREKWRQNTVITLHSQSKL